MHYEVVPFTTNIAKGQGAGHAAQQLQELVSTRAASGWKFQGLENVEINIHDPGSKGCFGFGAVAPSQATTRYDMAVFHRED
jgi:hypothetical protein